MSGFTFIGENILKLTTAYKDIFTTVYLLKAPGGAILFDAASYDEDIEHAVLPMLQQAGIGADTLKYVFISHNHKDHSGGLPRLMQEFPDTCIVSRSETLKETYSQYPFLSPEEGDLLLDTFRVVTIPGHTADSSALLDTRTMTLITGDGLQQHGIIGSGDWASNISYPAKHLAALKKLRTIGAEQILTAHDYVPWGYRADSAEAVQHMLDACEEPLRRLQTLILENPELDDGQIREAFSDFTKPLTISIRVVAAMRQALSQDYFGKGETL